MTATLRSVSDRWWLRLVAAWFTMWLAFFSIYMWLNRTTATDWDWFYKIAGPVAALSLLRGVVHPRVVGFSGLHWPLAAIALVRVVDFMQDWFLTRDDVEPLDIWDRLFLGSFGWSMILGYVVTLAVFERMLLSRWDGDENGALCWNAPGCPSHLPVEVDVGGHPAPVRHRGRSVHPSE